MTQRNRWVPTILLFPLLYLAGWIVVQPLGFVWVDIEKNLLSLIGTIVSLFFFVCCIPTWIELRWQSKQPWKKIGLWGGNNLWLVFLRGMLIAIGLIFCLVIFLLIAKLGVWMWQINILSILNMLFLIILVGIAEELIFRGWLFGELMQFFSSKWSNVFQAAIFSLAHIHFDKGFWAFLGLFCGLFLLGFCLGQRRRLDNGSIWGCIGLHGSLVGLWFLIQSGLLFFPSELSPWIIGPGGSSPNPIGGVISILFLLIFARYQTFELSRFKFNRGF